MGSTRSVQWMGDTAYRKSGCNIINGHAKDELEIEKQKKIKIKKADYDLVADWWGGWVMWFECSLYGRLMQFGRDTNFGVPSTGRIN